MKIELVEFKRCCFCIPLRYGLLVMAYLKLIVSTILFALIVIQAVQFTKIVIKYQSVAYCLPMTMLACLLIVCLGDIALSIVFLVGGHRKCPKLMRIYNRSAIGMLVIFSLVFILYVGVAITIYIYLMGLFMTNIILRGTITTGFIIFCVEIYMILMIKSEIAKLEDNHNFQFHNIGIDAECTMVDGSDGNNAICAQNSKPVDQCLTLNENEGNDQKEKKQSGNYSRLGD